ncbi:MAG: glycine cleavage system protein H [Proteobacteria bacterium]|nr:glycine cleavage system protein H [Pseudomonadota bacterium]
MAIVEGYEFPDNLLYDIENQVWYAPLADGTLRTGFTAWSAALMGDVLVFTPKRIGHPFEKDRWFAMVEGGKWIGAARAGFDGVVVAQNETLIDKPELLNRDPFGEGWMLIVRPSDEGWRDGLVTGAGVGAAIEAWIATGSYKDRTG